VAIPAKTAITKQRNKRRITRVLLRRPGSKARLYCRLMQRDGTPKRDPYLRQARFTRGRGFPSQNHSGQAGGRADLLIAD
jgi:hypothetical protein